MSSPTQRTLELLRDEGYLAEVTEHWVPFPPPGHRKDLFSFVDVLGVKDGVTIAVQTTSGSNLSARRAKLDSLLAVKQCIAAGWIIEIHGWRKLKVKRGGKAMRWAVNRERYER